ncbi:hypothetical protein A2188_03000 [Candidatus Woesebacteria bacterium RIFOXYA1_FULL_43_9]|uniref:Uncharacterized protein n=1 Tax=Candidatus Woesebacteria bacterium RIFOXYA1_FULL_43_9 TaxID=1802534 RepID=A0A1F8CMV4_9BACT|nr:MAG: hypothetical protein A2188_03000 [Candidatus Woesebacteria bacterium RIFOXYA1_FULL_43_9]
MTMTKEVKVKYFVNPENTQKGAWVALFNHGGNLQEAIKEVEEKSLLLKSIGCDKTMPDQILAWLRSLLPHYRDE